MLNRFTSHFKGLQHASLRRVTPAILELVAVRPVMRDYMASQPYVSLEIHPGF